MIRQSLGSTQREERLYNIKQHYNRQRILLRNPTVASGTHVSKALTSFNGLVHAGESAFDNIIGTYKLTTQVVVE